MDSAVTTRPVFPTGEGHYAWKGESPGYWAIHAWIRRKYDQTGICEHCGKTEGTTEWANRDHEYRRSRDDWMELCRSCHRRYDDKVFGRSKRPHLRKTHCLRGHLFDSTYPNGKSRCKRCSAILAQARRDAKKAAA